LKVTPLFDVKNPSNVTRYRHIYNRVPCDLSNGVIFNDLERSNPDFKGIGNGTVHGEIVTME